MTTQLTSAMALTPFAPEGLEVRLAEHPDEIRAAQRLRYQVFYQEMGAVPCARTRATGLDADDFDDVCDHLLALAGGEVVGTYRLIRRAAAMRVGGFYSAAEFDIAPLLRHPGELLELGRSCVDARWRSRGALQLLWQGLSAYMLRHHISLMFGCASLPGTDPEALAPHLAYLHDNHLAPLDLRARAHAVQAVKPPIATAYDPRQTLLSLPPLVKGYLKAGAAIGDGAVIDRQFNTTDVLVVLDTRLITERYQRRYERRAG